MELTQSSANPLLDLLKVVQFIPSKTLTPPPKVPNHFLDESSIAIA
jgi:hypothetical protein